MPMNGHACELFKIILYDVQPNKGYKYGLT